jgi:hypothetical protein
MSLTGMPLVVSAVVCTVAVLAGTVLLWNRWGGWRLLTRPVGVLLTEALVLVSVGLVVNRSEQFYPTWQSLFQAGYTGGTSYAAAPGGLDAWLAAQPGADSGQALAFTWRQAGWPGWGLSAPPTVVVPGGYLRHKGLRYPVIVVLVGATVAGTPGADKAGAAVVVYVHPVAAAKAAVLATDLAGAVSGALRVTAYRWAVVADPALAAFSADVVTALPTRYSTLADLCTAAVPAGAAAPATTAGVKPVSKLASVSAKKPATPAKTAATRKPATPAKTAATKKPAAPAKKPSAPANKPAAPAKKPATPAKKSACTVRALPAGVVWSPVAAGAGGVAGLPEAVAWVAKELPPPLAASTPPPAYLPPARRHPHPGSSDASWPPSADALSGDPKATAHKPVLPKPATAKVGAALTGVTNARSSHVAG